MPNLNTRYLHNQTDVLGRSFLVSVEGKVGVRVAARAQMSRTQLLLWRVGGSLSEHEILRDAERRRLSLFALNVWQRSPGADVQGSFVREFSNTG